MATDGGIPLVSVSSANRTNGIFSESTQRRLRNHRIITWRTRNQGQEDQIQRDLQRVINDSSLQIPMLLQDYLKMKKKPGYDVVSSLVWYSRLQFHSHLPEHHVDIYRLGIRNHHTLSQALESFRRSLNLGDREFLRIWYV
jgi:hypothetical protein